MREMRAVTAMIASLIVWAGLLSSAGAAGAAVVIYQGEVEGAGGSVELRVKTERKRGRTVKTVTRVGYDDVPIYCADGGSSGTDNDVAVAARVARSGAFEDTVHRVSSGFRSVFNVKGDVQGREIDGLFSFTGQNPLFGSCSTGVLDFTAFRTRPDRQETAE